MLKRSSITFSAIILTCCVLFAQGRLPVGSYPRALEFDYFPNRIYAFVWRNWNLVEPSRMAMTINCDVKDVLEIAASMGLPPAVSIPSTFKKQIYITVLRRNWHLLPYDQLLTLLDLSDEELEFSLKEDDFLFHKFGSLKPQCSSLKYTKPDEKALGRAQEIRQLVKKHFKAGLKEHIEPLFSFIADLSTEDSSESKGFRSVPSPGEGLRFVYSYFGVFGDPLIDTKVSPYPDGLLAKLSANGVNGIWMHVVLNQLAPGGKDFPEFGERHEERLTNLRQMTERAKRFGIKVYLYMNEPRAQSLPFFENRREMAGVQVGDFVTMCTSNARVLNWITNSLTHVFKSVPDLGGVFTITASENLTSCASHGREKECSRCGKRDYADIIAGVNEAIEKGVHSGNPDARVIVWDWGWHGHADAPDVIAKLPKSVWLMSVSEWAKPIERGGISSSIGEYSISAVGPGPRAQRHWALAKAAGLKTVAKVQFNNTWELSAIPWIPALDLVARHASNLAKVDIDGFMLSWTLGGYPSPNLEIAKRFSEDPDADPDDVLNALAIRRYGEKAAPFARQAWTYFSNAFKEFPYHQKVVYSAPQQYGPSNLLFARPTGYDATMVGFPYDDLDGWRGPYARDVFISQFKKVAAGWKQGLQSFSRVMEFANNKEIAEADWRIAKAAYLHFASAANQARFVSVRDSVLAGDLTKGSEQLLKKELNSLLDSEKQIAVELFEIIRKDSRIGFEASNQYYYVSQDLMEKVVNCEWVKKMVSDN